MNAITVIPIMKGVLQKELTYFSSKVIIPGDIVVVLVRKKEVSALVVKVEPVSNQKINLKQHSFELKKILQNKGNGNLSPAFVKAVQDCAEYHFCSTGALLFRILPKDFFETKNTSSKKDTVYELKKSPLVFQSSREERIGFYKTYIREQFAKKKSVFFCFPTTQDAEAMQKDLEKGVSGYTYVFHGELTPKKATERLSLFEKENHPVIVFTTLKYLHLIDQKDCGVIILEHESSPLYKTFTKPFFDIRVFIRLFASYSDRELILADDVLSLETLFESREGDLEMLQNTNYRLPTTNTLEIYNTTPEKDSSWNLITSPLQNSIENSILKNKKVILFTLRKGLAPFTVCNDCKKTLTCRTCDTPLTLYKQKTGSGQESSYMFVCNTCGTPENPITTCPYCNSWNLVPLGVGTQKVEEEIQKQFPETPIFLIDKQHSKTKTQAEKVLRDFNSSDTGILIATELILHHEVEPVDLVAVTSFDSLFAIPSFRIHERILHLLLKLKTLSDHLFVVQTKNPKSSILQTFKSGNLLQYYNEEITQREQFDYPPFSTLIKIVPEQKTTKTELKKVANELFGNYKPNIFTTTHNGKKTLGILIKAPRISWGLSRKQRDSGLQEALLSLPMSWTIIINPENT